MTKPDISGGEHYHCIIIGGGIQGCGVAQAMAAAGYSVLLIEKNKLGSGTSSKSSKLIHGGLRYLASGQFGLVRKSLQERALLLALAPSLIELKPFYLPIYRNARFGSLAIRAGLSLYSLLGGLHKDTRFKKLPRKQWPLLAGLNLDELQAVYTYYDAQTDDQLLTQTVGNSARELGATLLEGCTFAGACQPKSDQSGTFEKIAVSLYTGQQPNKQSIDVSCDLLINASGPWVTETLQKIDFAPPPPGISLIQGSHIELDTAISDAIFYVESPNDGRPVFVMPSPRGTIVGTTETKHTGKAGDSQPTQQEIDYLLKTLKHYFPNYPGKMTASWSGLRVLPNANKANNADGVSATRQFSDQSRDTMIDVDREDAPRLISLYGGKLTTYRATAEKIAEQASAALAARGVAPIHPSRDTASLSLQLPADHC